MNELWENLFRSGSTKRDVAKILKQNFLFETLTPRELKFVKELVHSRSFRNGEPVFRQGEVGVGMYIIVEGAVDIYVEDLQVEESDRQNVFVTRLSSGDFFGEISLVEENGKRSASAVASTDTHTLGFYKPDLLEIIERNPSTGSKILYRLAMALGSRLKETTNKVTDLKNQIKVVAEGQR